MFKKIVPVLLLAVTVGIASVAQTKPASRPQSPQNLKPQPSAKTNLPVLKTGIDSMSYAIGILDAGFFKQQGIDTLNYEVLKQAIQAVIEGDTTLIDPDMANNILRQKLQEAAVRKVQPTIDEGRAFMAENGKRAEVTTMPNGMQYEVLKMGEGPKPTAANIVKVHYVGTLINGTKFDSSRDRGEPAQFPLSGVIRGWTEGVPQMPVGSIFKFYIPYDLAYGLQGSPPKIPGGSALVFEIELLDIIEQ